MSFLSVEIAYVRDQRYITSWPFRSAGFPVLPAVVSVFGAVAFPSDGALDLQLAEL